MSSVVARNISKNYKDVIALDNVSFEVQKGELFGLIGPDGAGKTSLFRILTTLILADKGNATVEGLDVVKDFQAIRNQVGYMPGKFSLYQDLSVEENLQFFATVFGTTIEENYNLIKDVYDQLLPFKKRKAGKLSGGMKQKLALCCALIHKPEVLFLDEPTTGVDAVSRKEFWNMLKKLKVQNITIIVSTPYMDEAKLCDRIALIQNGKIMSIDTPDQIIRSFRKPLFGARAKNIYQLLKDLRTSEQIDSCFAFGDYLHITLKNEEAGLEDLKKIAQQFHPEKLEIKSIVPTIEDSFIQLMEEHSDTKSAS